MMSWRPPWKYNVISEIWPSTDMYLLENHLTKFHTDPLPQQQLIWVRIRDQFLITICNICITISVIYVTHCITEEHYSHTIHITLNCFQKQINNFTSFHIETETYREPYTTFTMSAMCSFGNLWKQSNTHTCIMTIIHSLLYQYSISSYLSVWTKFLTDHKSKT